MKKKVIAVVAMAAIGTAFAVHVPTRLPGRQWSVCFDGSEPIKWCWEASSATIAVTNLITGRGTVRVYNRSGDELDGEAVLLPQEGGEQLYHLTITQGTTTRTATLKTGSNSTIYTTPDAYGYKTLHSRRIYSYSPEWKGLDAEIAYLYALKTGTKESVTTHFDSLSGFAVLDSNALFPGYVGQMSVALCYNGPNVASKDITAASRILSVGVSLFIIVR